MFSLTAPSEDEVRRFIAKQKESGFSYPEARASASTIPSDYNVDRNRVQLGRGENTVTRCYTLGQGDNIPVSLIHCRADSRMSDVRDP